MVDFSLTTEISRPPSEIFAFMVDPANLSRWQDAEESEQITPGPVGAGTRFREVHRAMGRRSEQVTEFAVFEPGRRLDVRVVEGPVAVDGRWDLEPSDGGTRLTFRATGRLPGPLRLLEPVAVPVMRRNFRRFHRRLREAIEADAAGAQRLA